MKTFVLVLDDIVKGFKEQSNIGMIPFCSIEKSRRGEDLHQVDKFDSSNLRWKWGKMEIKIRKKYK